MVLMKLAGLVFLLVAGCLSAQEPVVEAGRPAGDKGAINAAAIAGSKQDPAAVARGAKVFAQYCAGCHGAAANGGPGAPDLVRSLLVLDDEKGLLIGPVVREGRPDKGMPKLGLGEPQIADVVAWLHARTYAAGHRGTYTFGNVATGDAAKGKAYFDEKCASCHSATGDLAGVGAKYDAYSLQGHWLNPGKSIRGGRNQGAKQAPTHGSTVTVTLSSGQTVSGRLEFIDDFVVALRDSSGSFHSFKRSGSSSKVEVHDPLQGHADLLSQYTDADIHNVTTYLTTLK
jgi:cytochrome c oxidase cbb3-type subunit 3